MGLLSYFTFRKARNELPKYNGVMTWNFSQMDFTVWNIIRKDDVSAHGICELLSAQWVVDHAYGGSLHNRVTDAQGKLSASAIRMIMQNFVAGYERQETQTNNFLVARGVLPRLRSRNITSTSYKKVGGKSVEVTRTAAQSSEMRQAGGAGSVGIALSQALRDVSNCYALVDFGGASAAHCTAVWIGGATYSSGGDAAYYDPNAGEFWFENKQNFFDWFTVFYESAYQGWPCNFNSSWTVRPYALSNTAAKGAYAKAVLSVAGPR
jgi:virulence surface antigen